MSKRLENKVAIVTGAGCVGPGWGNGRATVVRFAEEGALVLAVDRDQSSLAETLERVRATGGVAEPWLCDVTQEEQVAAMIAACKDRFGPRIDVLVNNVGGSAKGGPTELDPAAWQRQIDYNLTSVYLGCRHVLPLMVEQRAGAIVNLSSTSGLDRKSTRLNSSHSQQSRMPSSA